jgi:hypothetical protein
MITLPKNKFLRFQDNFYRQVIALPMKLTFIEKIVDDSADDYDKLVKAAGYSTESKTVRCMYRTNFTPWERTKFGLAQDATAIAYIPPQELIDLYGKFRLNFKTFDVQHTDLFNNEIYVVNKVKFQEPLYDSCICVELHLQSKVKN